jgi:hypothetical protein
MFLALILSIGQGAPYLDIVRFSIIGMVVFNWLFDKKKISKKICLFLECAAWLAIIGTGIFFKDWYIIMAALAFLAMIVLALLQVRLNNKRDKAIAAKRKEGVE